MSLVPREEEFSGTERFAVRRRLGGGGMGVVYEVFDHERRTTVALKTLRRISGGEIYRLKQEFRTLADVSHPNLVQLHELHMRGEQVFFTMELLEGLDFHTWLRRATGVQDAVVPADATAPTLTGIAPAALATPSTVSGRRLYDRAQEEPTLRLSPPSKARLSRLRLGLRQLATGIQALHDAGVIHRDIKPSNVIVTSPARVVLLDFGLASPTAMPQTSSDSGVVGTPAYMAPEQGAGAQATPASDWYAFGVILFEALTGRLPFLGRSLQILMDKQQIEPPAPRELAPEAPEDLDALCVALLRRRPAERPSGEEVLRRLGVQSGTQAAVASRQIVSHARTLVGREAEVAFLRQAFDDSRDGHCVVAHVRGASGIGKSALVRHVLDDLAASNEALVLSGRCYEMESVPFKAFDSLIDALSRHLVMLPRSEAAALMPREVALLARLFPVLLQVPAVADAPRRLAEPPDLQELRRRGFAALRELLLRLTDRRPLVLCIDDLQWGDADSAALLADLLRPPEPPPLLLVGIFRSEARESGDFARALAPALQSSGVAVDVRDLGLSALPLAAARELALRVAGVGDEPTREQLARAEAIARESSGSPFFVTELTRYVAAGAELAPDVLHAAGAPATLSGFLRARLERLPAAARRLLEVVSMAATPVAQAVARQAATLAGDAGLGADPAATVALLRAGHLVRTTGVRDLDTIEAYHDRIRETVTELVDEKTRKELHGALALALESSGRADPETIAFHHRGAGNRARAAHFTEQAAAQAADALAFQRAAVLYRQAIELHTDGETPVRLLRAALADALANAGSGPQAASEYLKAAEGGQAAEVLELNRRAAEQLLRSGHLDEGLAVLGRVLGAVRTQLAPTPRRALASLLFRRARVRLRGLHFRERDPSQVSQEALTRVDIMWSVSTSLGMVDNIRAADFQARHLLLALDAGEPYRVARALAIEACYSATEGPSQSERTANLVRRAREAAARATNPHALGMAMFADGFTRVMEGRFKEGIGPVRAAEEMLRERCRNVAWETVVLQQMSVVADFYLGELDGIAERLPRLVEQARARGDLYASSVLRTWMCILPWLLRDDVAGARATLDEVSQAWQSSPTFLLQHYWDMHARQHVDLYAGDGEAAWTRAETMWPKLERSLLLRISALHTDAWWHRARAALAYAKQLDGEPRQKLLLEGDRAMKKLLDQPLVPAVRELYAGDRALLEGRKETAVPHYRAAAGLAGAIGLGLIERVARVRLAEQGEGPRPDMPAGIARLLSPIA